MCLSKVLKDGRSKEVKELNKQKDIFAYKRVGVFENKIYNVFYGVNGRYCSAFPLLLGISGQKPIIKEEWYKAEPKKVFCVDEPHRAYMTGFHVYTNIEDARSQMFFSLEKVVKVKVKDVKYIGVENHCRVLVVDKIKYPLRGYKK